MPAEFLGNLPKNLTTHLTHKLCAVLPIVYHSFSEGYKNGFQNKKKQARLELAFALYSRFRMSGDTSQHTPCSLYVSFSWSISVISFLHLALSSIAR